MNKLRWLAVLMGIAIVGITGFQGYWLKDNYDRERQNLDIKTNAAFRQTILRLQASKLKLETVTVQMDSVVPRVRVSATSKPRQQKITWTRKTEPPITIVNLLQEKARQYEIKDSNGNASGGRIFISGFNDSLKKEFSDSLRTMTGSTMRGNVRSMVVTRTLDSFPPELVKEISVNPRGPGPRKMVVRYDSEDSISHTREGFEFERTMPPSPDVLLRHQPKDSSRNAFFQMVYSIDSLSSRDSVTMKEIDSAFTARLKEDALQLKFGVEKLDSSYGNSKLANEVTLGLSRPITYRLSLLNPSTHILKQLSLPILFSIFLVGISLASFILLYRNLLRQHRLSQIKDELISNITHELKTPIATVGVAIEALKNFNAIDDPQRTKEYLDISQNELQRLELLVDKVLKLSMFENKQITLQKENFDLKQLVEEVISSLRFQLEKQQAKVTLETSGERKIINANRLHITSVVYNLLDNALKYSGQHAEVKVSLVSHENYIEMKVADNGIGIPSEYKSRIFDKFFRVPSGNRHTTKGYGLGLSYVDHIVKAHKGSILVDSELSKGSTFTVNLPYNLSADRIIAENDISIKNPGITL